MTKIKNPSKKVLLIALVVLVIGGVAAYLLLKNDSKDSQQTTQNPNSQEKINLEPATEEDKQRADQNKQAIVDRDNQLKNQPPATGKKTIKPIISYAGQYGPQAEVGAYVLGVFEDGGTCTAAFTKDGKSFSKSVTAVKNVSSNDCPVMAAKNEEFSPKGSWSVVVSYSSASAEGASDAQNIEIK